MIVRISFASPAPPQDVDLHTYARIVLAMMDMQPAAGAGGTAAGLAEALYPLFATYLEFRENPYFNNRGRFGTQTSILAADALAPAAAAAGQPANSGAAPVAMV